MPEIPRSERKTQNRVIALFLNELDLPTNRNSTMNYYCKHCGTSNSSLIFMTSNPCMRHSSGPNKGKHEPAL
jgi:hypothetical protein